MGHDYLNERVMLDCCRKFICYNCNLDSIKNNTHHGRTANMSNCSLCKSNKYGNGLNFNLITFHDSLELEYKQEWNH